MSYDFWFGTKALSALALEPLKNANFSNHWVDSELADEAFNSGDCHLQTSEVIFARRFEDRNIEQ